MSKIKVSKLLLILAIFMSFTVNGMTKIVISGQAPTTGDPAADVALENAFNDAIAAATSNEPIINSDKDKLMKGFANSNVYATGSNSMIGFQNYSVFSISYGVIGAVHFPSDFSGLDVIETIEDQGDIELGVSAGASINIGLNASMFIEGLYLHLKVGTFDYENGSPSDDDYFKYETKTFGIGANYTFIEDFGLGFGMAKWRGVTFGTGLYYHENKVNANVDLESISQPYSGGAYSGDLIMDPSVNLGITMKNFVIPLEVSTSFQAMWIFNFGIGAGIDLSFGSSEIDAEAAGSVTATNSGAGTVTPGYLSIEEDTPDGSPRFINLRFTASPGLNFGPVKIEVPVTWYVLNGYSVGITAGAQF